VTRGSSPLRPHRDRWLISYADLVTLLLACFTTTFAATRIPEPSANASPVAPVAALPIADMAPVEPVPALDEEPPSEPEPVVPSAHDLLRLMLESLVAANGSTVTLIEDQRGLVLSLPESATFPVASAALSPQAQLVLRSLADQLQETPAVLRIEGHTDDTPVTGGRFASNWELSTARASAVVVFLIDQAGFAPERLSAAGYGEYHPRVANDSPELRALNRRVDVVVSLMEPAGAELEVAQ
jgi:chemotaxis protein MotB